MKPIRYYADSLAIRNLEKHYGSYLEKMSHSLKAELLATIAIAIAHRTNAKEDNSAEITAIVDLIQNQKIGDLLSLSEALIQSLKEER